MNRPFTHPTPVRLSAHVEAHALPAFNRRSFLTVAIGAVLGNLLMGCSGQKRQTLSLRVLHASVPPQLVGAFRKHLQQTAMDGALEVAIEPQLAQIFELLQTWKRKGQADSSGWFSQLPFSWQACEQYRARPGYVG